MSVLRQVKVFAILMFVTLCAVNQANAEVKFDEAKLRTTFESMGVTVMNIQPASIDGLVEVVTNGGVIFATPEGDQFIAGTLYALDKNGAYIDVLAERQAPLNAAKIEERKDEMIVYPAKDEKYIVTVFTDITCGYCTRLHNQMKGYNELGITVRYLAYPRQGPTGDVADTMAAIWCADDPVKAMSEAKDDHKYPSQSLKNPQQCKQTVSEHYMLGRELGISGTPAVFLPNGKLVAGYMPPAQLFARLEQESK